MDIKDLIRRGGGPSKIGRALGLSHSTVLGWSKVPAEHVLAVETETGISRHEIRPDVFGPAPTPEPAHGAAAQPAVAA